MPNLIAVVLGVGLPDGNEPIPIGSSGHAVSNLFFQDRMVFVDIQALEELLELLLALGTLHRRIRHAMGRMVEMGGDIEPALNVFLERFMEFLQNPLTLDGWFDTHETTQPFLWKIVMRFLTHMVMPLQGETLRRKH